MKQLLIKTLILILGRVGGVAANFAFFFLLAKYLNPSQVGIIALVISTALLTSTATTFNMESASLRYFAHAKNSGDIDKAASFAKFSKTFWIIASPIVCGLYYLLSPNENYYIVGTLLIPAYAYLRMKSRQSTSIGHPIQGGFPNLLYRPIILLLLFMAIVYSGIGFDEVTILTLALVACIMAILIQSVLIKKPLEFLKNSTEISYAESGLWIRSGLMMSGVFIVTELFPDLTTALASPVASKADIAILIIAIKLVSVSSFAIASIDMAIQPKISVFVANNDIENRNKYLLATLLFKLPSSILFILFLYFFGEIILSVFGEEYTKGYEIVLVLSLMPFISAILGPNVSILNLYGEHASIMISAFIALFVASIAIPTLGYLFGIFGVAIGAVLFHGSWEAAAFFFVKTKTDVPYISPYSYAKAYDRPV